MKNLVFLLALLGSMLMSSCWVWYDEYYERPPRRERPMRSGHYHRDAPPPPPHGHGRPPHHRGR